MSHFRLLAVGAALAGVLLAIDAAAALRPNTLTISPRAGAYRFETEENLENAPVYSLGVGYQFSSNWSSELHGAYLETRHDIGEEQDVKGYVGRMEVLYHFRSEKSLVPHLAAGLGFLALDRSGSINADGFAGYGFGLQYFLTPDISFSLDGRHQFRETGDFTASAGVGYCFGSEEKDRRIIDTDGDGVIDVFDRCPGTRLGIPVDGYGCPADGDRDGVLDYLDQCRATASGATVNADGCSPDEKDGSGTDDGGGTGGTAIGIGTAGEKSGCPGGITRGVAVSGDPIAEPAEKDRTSVVLHLPFAPEKAEIRPEFTAALLPAVDFLRSHPAAKFIVEAHTDGIGTREKNLRLSQTRAEAVRQFLIENGPIAPERIQAKGFGETQPIADETTQRGRAQNRRVVVRLQEGG